MLACLFRPEVRTANSENAVVHMGASVVATSRTLTPELLLRLAIVTDAVTHIASNRIDATSFAQVTCIATLAVRSIFRFVSLKLHARSCVMRAIDARAFGNLFPLHRNVCGARSVAKPLDDSGA